MTPLEAELAREQEHVDRARARLEVLREEALQRERTALRPTGGDPQSVYERDVAALNATARRLTLDESGEGLVFGRLDTKDGAVLHLGRIGLRTEDQEPLVVDWRAPAAAPFYRATAADPLGVVRRRTIVSRGPRVTGIEDELLDPDAEDVLDGTTVVGDGAFLAAVSRERTAHMRDIVATIQAEQDRAVRAPDDGALVVTGGPGTGKTAVALHRVAYLMYAKREHYSRRGVLVVGPSPVFVDYVSHVLPSLGETSARLASLASLPTVPRGTEVTAYDSAAAAVVKGSARMARVLRRAVRELTRRGRVEDLVLTRWQTPVVVRADELRRRRDQVARGHRSHNAGRAAFVSQVVDVVWRATSRATREGGDDREDVALDLRLDDAWEKALDRLWPVLTPMQVFEALRRGDVPLERAAGGLLSREEQAALRASWEPGGPLSPADAALLDELDELLGPVPEPEPDPLDDGWDELAELDDLARMNEVTTFADRTRKRPVDADDRRTYAHVVVDEAQDVSPMQWRVLGRRGRGATWTVVGDWAQSAWPDVDEVRDAMAGALGRARVREAVLSTNYRTSTEVADLAARLLRRIDAAAVPPRAVRSTGVEPVLHVGAPQALLPGVVADLLAEVSGTVGVVCPRSLVAAVRSALPDDPRLTVLDTWQAKGLEFDGCCVVDPHAVVAEGLTEVSGLRTLYVALTRATQRLAVVGPHPLEELLT